MGPHNLFHHEPIHLVIVGWPCQGHFSMGHGNGLQSILHVLGNVTNVLSFVITPNTFFNLDYGECVIDGWFLSEVVGKWSTYLFLDWTNHVAQCDTKISSRVHWLHLWWTNLLPPQLLKWAYDEEQKSSLLTIDNILNERFRLSQLVRFANKPLLPLVNKVGWPQVAFSTLHYFFAFHAFHDNGPRLNWDTHQ